VCMYMFMQVDTRMCGWACVCMMVKGTVDDLFVWCVHDVFFCPNLRVYVPVSMPVSVCVSVSCLCAGDRTCGCVQVHRHLFVRVSLYTCAYMFPDMCVFVCPRTHICSCSCILVYVCGGVMSFLSTHPSAFFTTRLFLLPLLCRPPSRIPLLPRPVHSRGMCLPGREAPQRHLVTPCI
jgi:hypothetical protein